MSEQKSSEATPIATLLRRGVLAVVAFIGLIAAAVWTAATDRYSAKYIGTSIVSVTKPVKAVVIYPQLPDANLRYAQFQQGFNAELARYPSNILVDEMFPGVDGESEKWLTETVARIRDRGDIEYVVAIGTQVTRACCAGRLPQKIVAGFVSSSAAIRAEIDETDLTLLRDVSDSRLSGAAVSVARFLSDVVHNGADPARRAMLLEWAGEASSRQVRMDLSAWLAQNPKYRIQHGSILDRDELFYTIDRMVPSKEPSIVVLQDRKLLNERALIAELSIEKGLVFVTSCPDDVQDAEGFDSPVAGVGYVYEELGKECAQGFVSKLRADNNIVLADSVQLSFVPQPFVCVNVAVLSRLCQTRGEGMPSPVLRSTLKDRLAGIASKAKLVLKIVGDGALPTATPLDESIIADAPAADAASEGVSAEELSAAHQPAKPAPVDDKRAEALSSERDP